MYEEHELWQEEVPSAWPELPARVAGLIPIAQQFDIEEEHTAQVTRLAASLFDQLAAYHGLGDKWRELLLAAGVLHDIGLCVALQGHNKHSRRLIQQTPLPGFKKRERRVISLLARYHRGVPPRETHRRFSALKPQTQEAVRRLAAILRVADGLDRTHASVVQDVRVDKDAGGFRLVVSARGDARWEILAARKKGNLFEEVYGPLRIEVLS
ncbi:MAG: HD domain-containing protein [Armatimonadetes bacterium]|nr:HD domain-containing protein [Armatimonadota bacterium]